MQIGSIRRPHPSLQSSRSPALAPDTRERLTSCREIDDLNVVGAIHFIDSLEGCVWAIRGATSI